MAVSPKGILRLSVIYTVLGEHSVIVAAVGNWKVTRKALARAGNGLR